MDPVKRIIEDHWRRVWNFAYRMTLDRDLARECVEETYLRVFIGSDKIPADKQREPWLFRIATHVVDKRTGRGPEVSFDLLDDKLRSEATRTDVVKSMTSPTRDYYLWELKQGCMTSVVNCLPPGERVAFVLSAILSYSEEDAATVLGITQSAFKVRLSRARKKVTDYLAPRCEHVDPRNPCRCPSRLGVALDRGFIPMGEVKLRPAFGRYGSVVEGEDAPLRDVMAIYHALPDPDPPEEFPSRLLMLADSAVWADLRERSRRAERA